MSAPRSPLGLLLLLFTAYSDATIVSVSASEVGGPTRSTTSPQGSADRQAVIDVRTAPGVDLPGPTFGVQVSSLKGVTTRVPEC